MTTNEERESQKSIIADNLEDKGKIKKTLQVDSSGIENYVGKWLGHLIKAMKSYWMKKCPRYLQNCDGNLI